MDRLDDLTRLRNSLLELQSIALSKDDNLSLHVILKALADCQAKIVETESGLVISQF